MDTDEEPSGLSLPSETETGHLRGYIICIVVGLYIDGELPQNLFQQRMRKLQISESNFYVLSSSTYGCGFNLSEQTFQKALLDDIENNEIDVVIFDNLASLAPGIDENSKQGYDPINQFFLQMRREGKTCIIVHHTNKSNNGEQRGTSARTDNIDIWINLDKKTENEEKLAIYISVKKWRYEKTPLMNNASFCLYDDKWIKDDGISSISTQDKQILAELNIGKNQGEIAKIINCSQPNISKLCKKLKKLELLNENLSLTELGISIIT